MQVDVLSLEWAVSQRDRETTNLINLALRDSGYSVHEASIFDWRYQLVKRKPKLLLVSNVAGASVNYEAVKFASQKNIPVVTLVSEGNFRPELIELFLWGWNKDKVFYEIVNCQWSTRTRDLSISRNPELRKKIIVSGAAGFDKHIIYEHMNRKQLCERFKKKYSKLIGIAGWGFDLMYGERHQESVELYGEEQVRRYQQDGFALNEIYYQLISSNPEILFLLKEHPGVVGNKLSEFECKHDLRLMPNTLLLKRELSIADCINACDLWAAYESTTCLEAWLLGKQTFLVNPSGPDFMRDNVHQGSPVLETLDEVQEVIDVFYKDRVIPGFNNKRPAREKIIRETIQWSDGKNHQRAAYFIKQVLSEADPARQKPYSLRERLIAYAKHFSFVVSGLKIIPNHSKIKQMKSERAFIKEIPWDYYRKKHAAEWEKFTVKHPFTKEDESELLSINEIH